MEELDFINTHLGGHDITIKGVQKILSQRPPQRILTIAEIGCGGGDNLAAIERYLKKKSVPVQFIGIDIKKECIDYAREKFPGDGMEWIVSDYKDVHWESRKPDIIFSSLFCHHFREDELVWMLKWMKNESDLGFFVNDLHRHFLAFQSIRLLTRAFSRSRLVKNDAPLSVRRGFIRADWQQLLRDAGIGNYEIEWKWAFRWLITVVK